LGYFEDYYDNKESEKLIERGVDVVIRYNKIVKSLNSGNLISKVLDYYKLNPPTSYKKVCINGQDLIAWELRTSYQTTDSFEHAYLLSDGSLSYGSWYGLKYRIPVWHISYLSDFFIGEGLEEYWKALNDNESSCEQAILKTESFAKILEAVETDLNEIVQEIEKSKKSASDKPSFLDKLMSYLE